MRIPPPTEGKGKRGMKGRRRRGARKVREGKIMERGGEGKEEREAGKGIDGEWRNEKEGKGQGKAGQRSGKDGKGRGRKGKGKGMRKSSENAENRDYSKPNFQLWGLLYLPYLPNLSQI